MATGCMTGLLVLSLLIPTILMQDDLKENARREEEERLIKKFFVERQEVSETIPMLRNVPENVDFTCKEKIPGYYADVENECQAFHICLTNEEQFTLLCPNGTTFNQKLLTCDWWFKSSCEEAPIFYHLNENIYKTPEQSENKRNEGKSLNPILSLFVQSNPDPERKGKSLFESNQNNLPQLQSQTSFQSQIEQSYLPPTKPEIPQGYLPPLVNAPSDSISEAEIQETFDDSQQNFKEINSENYIPPIDTEYLPPVSDNLNNNYIPPPETGYLPPETDVNTNTNYIPPPEIGYFPPKSDPNTNYLPSPETDYLPPQYNNQPVQQRHNFNEFNFQLPSF